jgi:hypothetical protein
MRFQRLCTMLIAAMLLALGLSRANRPASAGGDAIVYLPVVLHTAGPGVWVTIFEDDFEGSFPQPSWTISETGTGDYQWAQRACVAHSGTYSLWAIGGGEDGSDLTCGANYPHHAQSWMVAGPFDLSGATAAALDYQAQIFTESLVDGVIACSSPDNADFDGCVLLSGDSHGDWLSAAGVPGGELYRSMFDGVLGDSSVWLGLTFESNGSLIHPNGAFVDDLVLRKCIDGECPAASTASARPASSAQVSALLRPLLRRRP